MKTVKAWALFNKKSGGMYADTKDDCLVTCLKRSQVAAISKKFVNPEMRAIVRVEIRALPKGKKK